MPFLLPAEGLVCGVDEAGRGPLAGPVVAAAVILDPGRPIAGLNDSKKLSARKREALAEQIRGTALAWGVAEATAAEIDQINILQASLLAMQRAVAALTGAQGRVSPSRVLVDGTHCPSLSCPVEAILGGDGKVASIAAASILAKTFRDAGMLVLHASHPQYGFDRHKGYPTAMHLQALREYGASVQHRRSYAPVARLGQP
ncbi:MAG: ribonuclease HII [Candidatus Accumulibacter sp.]|jgi:ribonuclease HII|uniref:ribonuclease HII n=1 Tax=unclassified Candidatus Accumulibacter TaxID=2619054 RepID=UPI001A461041|nr:MULTISPECIES: ribonuclease HII [unclassified Candidatus Accumulibacter]MBL8369302.1 ribonuclease HII [Accumulibacter sp.]MBN8513727.1 ribonuclease HII [Accumulibacter sp.]MBO3701231.1 ribonuclease HII [Accumulibacter sp.]